MIPMLMILIGALTVVGIINRTRSICAGRRGYRFFQPLYDVDKLMRKGALYSTSSTIVTRIAPSIYLASIFVASLMIPLGRFGALIHFDGDIIVVCYLLALSHLVLIWGAMDSGGGFQAIGAARQGLWSLLAEPAMLLLVGTLCLITGRYSLSAIFERFENIDINLLILSVVVGYGFFKLALVECGRLPIDDTHTHLELTMTHHAMILDFTGIDLAYIKIGGWFKFSIFALLFANTFIPAYISGWMLGLLYISFLLLFGVAVGLLESFWARNRMNKNATYIVSISAIGLMAFIVAYLLSTNLL